MMELFDHPEFRNHQQIHFFEEKKTGLRTIIAIHHLINGISGGGCRFYSYRSTDDALTDVLRLSRAMTYKFALAGIAMGGAKSVIIGNSKADKTEALLESFGSMVESLGGQYVTAGDVGTNEEDMLIVQRKTRFVTGVKGQAGDTSRLTGYGVYQSIRAAVKYKTGSESLKGLRVAVQGAGGVGLHLVRHLLSEGAQVVIADLDAPALAQARKLGVQKTVAPESILFQEADVLAPCALGSILNEKTIPNIKAPIIVGGANNQLAKKEFASLLQEKDILLVPDFIANAGGAIQATGHMEGKTEDAILAHVNSIYKTTMQVLEKSRLENITPLEAAYRLGEEKLKRGRD